MKKNVIVSLADANYFPLLEELVDSIKRFKESEKVAICILDAGLTSEQKEKLSNKVNIASSVGKRIGVLAKKSGISQVKFDRGGYLYHGRVKALAEGARESGLIF